MTRSPCPHVVLATFLLAAFAAMAAAQEIAVVPKLRQGDEFRLEITRTRQNGAQPGRAATNSKSTTTVTVHVVAVTPEGIDVEWVPGETEVDRPTLAGDPLLAAAAEILEGLRLRIRLSADGEYQALVNEGEVAPRLVAAVDMMLGRVGATMREPERADFRKMMSQILTPAALLSLITSDVQTYFALNGVTIDRGETIEVPMEQPNPLGGATLPATFRITAESATADSAVLRTATVYDKEAFNGLVRSILEKAGKPVPDEALAQVPPLEWTDEGRFVLDRQFGLLREVVIARRMSMGGTVQRLDGWNIRLLSTPKR